MSNPISTQFPPSQVMDLDPQIDLSSLIQNVPQMTTGTPPIETLLSLEHQVTSLLSLPCTRAEFNTVTDIEQVYCQGVIAIGTIAANKLYRYTYPTKFTGLESYFRAKFNLSRAQVYRFLNCSVVVTDLLSAPQHLIQFVRPLPLRQRVAKAIKDLAFSPTDRQVLWATVLTHQPKGVDVTSTDVYRVARLIEKYRANNDSWCPAPFRSCGQVMSDSAPFRPCGLVLSDTLAPTSVYSSNSENYPSPSTDLCSHNISSHNLSSDQVRKAYPSPIIKQWRNRPAGKAPVPINQGYDTTALQCLAQVALNALRPQQHFDKSNSPCLPNVCSSPPKSELMTLPYQIPSPVSPNYPSDMYHFQGPETTDEECVSNQWHCHLPSIHQVLESSNADQPPF